MGYRCFGASLPMRICIMVRIRQDPPHTRMWRDDLKITANRSGLHLVSYTEASHRTGRPRPPREVDRRRPVRWLASTSVRADRKTLRLSVAKQLRRRQVHSGMAHYRSARAFAVNPARLTARPCGLRGLTANRGPSKKESPCQNARERPPSPGQDHPQPNRWIEQADRRACGNFLA